MKRSARFAFGVILGTTAVFSVLAQSQDEHKMLAPQDIKWSPGPPSLPPGVEVAALYGDATKDGGIVVSIWWKPFILCIWLGAVIMSIGGFVSLSDRRLRVGAPSRKARVKPVAPVMPEPAE